MLPTPDAVWVGQELQRRFGLPFWQFALTVSTIAPSSIVGGLSATQAHLSRQAMLCDAAHHMAHQVTRLCSGKAGPWLQFSLRVTLQATDATRVAIRLARHLTGRQKVLVLNYCYHGSVDETFITLQ
jgi:hypothetical protein